MIDESFDNDCLEIGFVEKAEPWHLLSYQFPSKVGGRPAWLSLEHVPSREELNCPLCNSTMAFLLQIYCPVDEREDCYHRMLYIFMCREGTCYSNADDSRPLRVLRCQLPKDNKFYCNVKVMDEDPTFQEVEEMLKNGEIPRVSQYFSECAVCGIPGTKTCVNCKQISYCSKEHQVIDWKSGHKDKCSQYQSGCAEVPLVHLTTNRFLLPEFELLLSPIPNSDKNKNRVATSDANSFEKSMLKDLNIKSEDDGNSIAGLEDLAKKETDEDRMFLKFKREIQSEPEQVVRYSRGGKPLWISTKAFSDSHDLVPPCGNCGAPRQFEFQVMPQLLHYLNLEVDTAPGKLHVTPDWGCLYVYTCSESCKPSGTAANCSYVQEIVFRHDVR